MTALIMNTLPTLPTAARDARSSSRANLDQSELRVTGDTDSIPNLASVMFDTMSTLLKPNQKQLNFQGV
jgi:hypothetical protein